MLRLGYCGSFGAIVGQTVGNCWANAEMAGRVALWGDLATIVRLCSCLAEGHTYPLYIDPLNSVQQMQEKLLPHV